MKIKNRMLIKNLAEISKNQNDYMREDIAFAYGKTFISLLDDYEPKTIDFNGNEIITTFNKAAANLMQDKTDNSKVFTKLKKLTEEYLILINDANQIKKLKNLNKWNDVKDYCFEIAANALLEARKKSKHVIETQFTLIEAFIYLTWFFASPDVAINILSKFNRNSFAYPGVDFDSQYMFSIESAKKNFANDDSEEQNISIVEGIMRHFVFHSTLLEVWKDLKKTKLDKKTYARMQHEIYEWLLQHYLLPLYMCQNGFIEKDQNFQKLIKQLFDYEFNPSLITQGCEALIGCEKLVANSGKINLMRLFDEVKDIINDIQLVFNEPNKSVGQALIN